MRKMKNLSASVFKRKKLHRQKLLNMSGKYRHNYEMLVNEIKYMRKEGESDMNHQYRTVEEKTVRLTKKITKLGGRIMKKMNGRKANIAAVMAATILLSAGVSISGSIPDCAADNTQAAAAINQKVAAVTAKTSVRRHSLSFCDSMQTFPFIQKVIDDSAHEQDVHTEIKPDH